MKTVEEASCSLRRSIGHGDGKTQADEIDVHVRATFGYITREWDEVRKP